MSDILYYQERDVNFGSTQAFVGIGATAAAQALANRIPVLTLGQHVVRFAAQSGDDILSGGRGDEFSCESLLSCAKDFSINIQCV